MLEGLKLKQKDSCFYNFVQCHYSIGHSPTHNWHEDYLMNYKEWRKQFTYSHGDLDTQRKVNLAKINCAFDIKVSSQEELLKFVFAIDSFYLALLALCAAKKLDSTYDKSKLNAYLSMGFFREFGIANYYLPSNAFIADKDPFINKQLTNLAAELEKVSISSDNTDLIREVFHAIYPREVRHSLGEFYTPDWMAQHIINENLISLGTGITMDPTCGSGTFLTAAIQKLTAQNNDTNRIHYILGFDINPTTAFAAKTNLILNLRKEELIGSVIPVFNANILDVDLLDDTINTYDEAYDRIKNLCLNNSNNFKESDIIELERISKLVPFLSKEKVSTAVGNPPWVNWEYLPAAYKSQYKSVWQKYGLFDYKGMNSIFIKEDISSLITYITIGHYLKPKGSISFVVKESLFKSVKQAAGFRKFVIGNQGTHFKIRLLEDLTAFNPFASVNNNTVIFHATKDEATAYPVDYIVWQMAPKSKLLDTDNICKAKSYFSKTAKVAIPSNPLDNTSGWASLDTSMHKNIPLLTGKSDYKARTGVFTGGANGIFWLKILNDESDNCVLVENITERAKIKFKKVQSKVEKGILYPYASGSDLRMWSFTYGKYIICPHNADTKMYPLSLHELTSKYPCAVDFFNSFQKELSARKGFTSFDKKIHDDHYYTLQRIGDYTFAKYKVAWKYISSSFTCAVISNVEDKILGARTVIPNEKIIYVGLDDKQEAYYLCGILSSTYFRELINSFKVSTQIAPSIINNLNIPRFDSNNPAHLKISSLCEEGHKNLAGIEKFIAQIDKCLLTAISRKEHQINKVALPAPTAFQEELAFA